MANALAFSVIITWVFNRTRESLPAAMLVHSSNNNVQATVWLAAFPALDTFRDMLTASLIGYGALAIVLVVATRGRLGYVPAPAVGHVRATDQAPANCQRFDGARSGSKSVDYPRCGRRGPGWVHESEEGAASR